MTTFTAVPGAARPGAISPGEPPRAVPSGPAVIFRCGTPHAQWMTGIPGLSAAVPALPVIPAPAIPLISVFPDPVPSGATALIYINAADPNASSMTFSLTSDYGPAPQPTADISIWTWVAP